MSQSSEGTNLELNLELTKQQMFNHLIAGETLELSFSCELECVRFQNILRVFVSRQRTLMKNLGTDLQVGVLKFRMFSCDGDDEVVLKVSIEDRKERRFSVKVISPAPSGYQEGGE